MLFILFSFSHILYGVVISIIIQKVLIIITLNIGGHLIINEWFGFINKFTHMYHCAVTLGYVLICGIVSSKRDLTPVISRFLVVDIQEV